MYWFTFIPRMTEALAWPLVVLGIAFLFRVPISTLIRHMRSLKLPGGAEATFAEEIKAAESKAKAIEPAKPEVQRENNARLLYLIELAAISPSGAVLEAWKDVEGAARALAETSGLPLSSNPQRPYFNLQNFLARNELLPGAELATFKELRIMRNRAAHASDESIAVDEARRYVRLADRLVDAIRSL